MSVGLLLAACAAPAKTTIVPSASLAPIGPTALPATVSGPFQPGDSERKLAVGGLERSYQLHVPPGLDASQPIPVVFFFHGYNMGVAFAVTLGFNDISDKNGFLLVYPTGEGVSWNATTCCGDAASKNIDDIGFVRAMLADLGRIARIDQKRIYSTGFSNGAFFSYRLGCEMSDTFAAIAPVSGALFTNPCRPGQPVSLISFHGSSDASVPYAQGLSSFNTWANLDGCSGSAKVDTQVIVNTITHSVFAACQAGSAVEFYGIAGQGHAWPPESVYHFNEKIWEFFAAHPKP